MIFSVGINGVSATPPTVGLAYIQYRGQRESSLCVPALFVVVIVDFAIFC